MIEIVPLGQLSLAFMSSFYCQLDKSVSPLNSGCGQEQQDGQPHQLQDEGHSAGKYGFSILYW